MKKTVIVILLTALCLFALCSCNNGGTADVTTNDEVSDAPAVTTNAETGAENTEKETETETETEAGTETETEPVTTAEETEADDFANDPMHFRRVHPEDFPAELSFLIPENKDDYIFMMPTSAYLCIAKSVITLEEAQWFGKQCEEQGMTKEKETVSKSDDGTYDEYSARFTSDKYDIHIFTTNITYDQLQIEITIK